MNTACQLNPTFHPSATCPRCQGFRIVQPYCDVQDISNPTWFFSLRCLNCGSIEDPQIVNNRSIAHRSQPLRRKLPQKHGAAGKRLKDSGQKGGKKHTR
jgi:hypothetical protein